MTGEPDPVRIEFRDDEAFRKEITEGNPDPIGGVRIRVGDQYLVGNEDGYLPTWVTDFILRVVDTGIDVADGERRVVVNHNGPSYLVVDPVDDSEVEVSHRLVSEAVDNPDEYPELVETATITPEAFIDGVGRDGQRLLETILDYNPDLEETDHISALQKVLTLLDETDARD